MAELDRLLAIDGVSLVGINNRNLQDFSVRVQTTCELLEARGKELQERNILVVSESGLYSPGNLGMVVQAGASAVLIGESLVKEPDPELAIANLFLKSS